MPVVPGFLLLLVCLAALARADPSCPPNSCPNVVTDASGNADVPGKLGVGTNNPSASSALQVDSTTGDFVPPRETTAQMLAINAPLDGGIIYNSDTKAFEGRVNGAWLPFSMQGFQMYADVKASNTAGGSSVANAWTVRTLNTAVMGDLDGVYTSLANNQITIQPGKYYVDCSAPAFGPDRQMLRWYSVTDAAAVQTGQNAYVGSGTSSESVASVWAYLTLTTAKTYEVDYYYKVATANNGLGVELNVAGVSEMYAVCKIFKWA